MEGTDVALRISDSPTEEFPYLQPRISYQFPWLWGGGWRRKLLSPQVVSIGPLHRENENVQASEGLKTRYMDCLLSRMHTPKLKVLESCVRKVYSLLKQIKACYPSSAIDFHDTALVEMMVVDACFILEFMLQNLEKPHIRNFLQIKSMLHDLVLIENQIPFFVLDQIFQCTLLTIYPKASLVELLVPVLSCNNIFKMDINIKGISTNHIPHIFGLLHYSYRDQVDEFILYSQKISTGLRRYLFRDYFWDYLFRDRVDELTSYCMSTCLYRDLVDDSPRMSTFLHTPSSVFLKPRKDSKPCLGINYSRLLNRLTLTMPVLFVDDRTESILWNFIAYELSCADKPYASHKPITSYINSICMLIRTVEDVAKLIDSGVLVNHLGSNEAVASIFNTILQYENKLKPPNKNCDGSGIWMRSTYVGSPWNIIALLAVIIMFALLVAHTIFTTKYGGSNKWARFLLFG